MSALEAERKRQVIPRWHTLNRAITAGELRYGVVPITRDFSRGLSALEEAWRSSNTAFDAAEFAGAAMTAGMPEIARDAIEVLADGGPLHRVVADGLAAHELESDSQADAAHPRTLRAAIRRDVRNSLAWLELGRCQLISGHREAAHKSISVASQLAPSNRYVVRSSACFYVEIGEPDRAAWLLARAVADHDDPWLIAPEIAARHLCGVRSHHLTKKRKQLLQIEGGDWFAFSELAAQIGTIEAENGQSRRAKRLLDAALIDPTENALAQVVAVERWAGAIVPEYRVSEAMMAVSNPSEARAIQAVMDSDFEASTLQAQNWLQDQPFSLDAAEFGSFIAAAGCENWHAAVKFAESGLRVHPRSVGLMNNLAYAQIELGDLDEADRLLGRAELECADERSRAVLSATRGLLEYRKGNRTAGALRYMDAVTLAEKIQEPVVAASAHAMHARETGDVIRATEMLQKARKLVRGQNPVITALIDKIEARL